MRKEKKYTIIYLSVCIIFLIVSITVSILKNTNTNTKLAKKEEIKSVQSEEYLDETINSNEITEVSNFEEEEESVSEEFENKEESEFVEVKEEELEKEEEEIEKEKLEEKEEQSYFKIVNANSTNKTKTEKTSNTSKTERKEKTEREKAAEALKKVLKDKKWLKENVMMDTSCFDTKLEYEQTLTFMLLKGGKDVIVQACSEEDLSIQIFLVSYNNGKITVTPFDRYPSHYYHVGFGVDANNFIVEYCYMHMGNSDTTTFKITENDFEKVKEVISYDGIYNEELDEFVREYEIDGKSVTEEEYKNAIKTDYNINSIDTLLNDENVNKYIY